MMTAEQVSAITRVNGEWINRAAKQLLPDDWQSDGSLHVLALALRGITEGGLHFRPGNRVFPHDENIESVIIYLMDCDPDEALRWIQGHESYDDGSVELTLSDDALDGCETAEDGASIIIEEIASGLEAERPLPRRWVKSLG